MNFMNMQKYSKIIMNFKKIVDKTLEKNDIIFDIDWQGTKQLSNFNDLNLIKIFLVTSKKSDL